MHSSAHLVTRTRSGDRAKSAGVGEVQVNTYTTENQNRSRVPTSGDGAVLVSWRSGAGTVCLYPKELRGRWLVGPIFEDGFESGDVESWSTAAP